MIAATSLGLAVPAAAQGGSISVTPATDLADQDEVDVVASTDGAPFGTIGLCEADQIAAISAPGEGIVHEFELTLPRFIGGSVDCVVIACAVVFATWEEDVSLVGLVSATVSFDPNSPLAPLTPAEYTATPAVSPEESGAPARLARTGPDAGLLLGVAVGLVAVSGAFTPTVRGRRR